MLWNWNTVDACFVASSWRIENAGMMVATCIGIILLAVLVEFARRIGKEYDAFLTRQFQRQASHQARSGSLSVIPGTCSTESVTSSTLTFRASLLQQLLRALVHAVTFGGAYVTMLLVMYCNGYIIICVILGAGIGKFLCDWFVVRIDVAAMQPTDKPAGGIAEPTVCCG